MHDPRLDQEVPLNLVSHPFLVSPEFQRVLLVLEDQDLLLVLLLKRTTSLPSVLLDLTRQALLDNLAVLFVLGFLAVQDFHTVHSRY